MRLFISDDCLHRTTIIFFTALWPLDDILHHELHHKFGYYEHINGSKKALRSLGVSLDKSRLGVVILIYIFWDLSLKIDLLKSLRIPNQD